MSHRGFHLRSLMAKDAEQVSMCLLASCEFHVCECWGQILGAVRVGVLHIMLRGWNLLCKHK